MKIAVLGLGIIGSAWAKNLQADGHEVRTWNRTPKDFSGFIADPKKAIKGAEFIFIVVSDPAAVQKVLDQILPVLTDQQLVLQSSTISADWTKKFAQQVESKGAKFLEAPFTGSKVAAQNRQTVFYVGGDPKLLERARPILEKISKTIIHIGPIGTASSLKLAMNMNIAQVSQALSESLAFAQHEGVSNDKFFEALEANASCSGIVAMQKPMLLKEEFSPSFSLKNMDKDLRLALESAGDLSLSQTRALKKSYEEGIARGWENDNYNVLFRLAKEKHALKNELRN